jgi:hypothetical protein
MFGPCQEEKKHYEPVWPHQQIAARVPQRPVARRCADSRLDSRRCVAAIAEQFFFG